MKKFFIYLIVICLFILSGCSTVIQIPTEPTTVEIEEVVDIITDDTSVVLSTPEPIVTPTSAPKRSSGGGSSNTVSTPITTPEPVEESITTQSVDEISESEFYEVGEVNNQTEDKPSEVVAYVVTPETGTPTEQPTQEENTTTEETEVVLTELQEYIIDVGIQGIAISEYFSVQVQSEFDKYSLLYPYALPHEYFEIRDFALELTKDCSTDAEKMETIFNWVHSDITYNLSAANLSTYNAFISRNGVCSQQATIMHDMLSAVGIESFYVSGLLDETFSTSLIYAINSYYYITEGKHAWVIAKIDDEWAYYDATNNYYAMTPEDLASNGLIPTFVDAIHCLPEDYDITLTNIEGCDTEAPILIYRDDTITPYRNAEFFPEYQLRSYYNNSFYINKQTHTGKFASTSHVFFFGDEQPEENDLLVNCMWYQATTNGDWADPDAYDLEKYSTRFWVYTVTGRRVHGIDFAQYICSLYDNNTINKFLLDLSTPFSVSGEGFCITYENEVYLLESFKDHNETNCIKATYTFE